MKKRVLSFLIAMMMASLSVPSVSAAETAYAKGDVDMDGVITGHDTAMVSRSLYDETYTLTEEQYILADMNDDGVVDLTDMETLHGLEVYGMSEPYFNNAHMVAAYTALLYVSYKSAGMDFTVYESTVVEDHDVVEKNIRNGRISNLMLSLFDVNASGDVDFIDGYSILVSDSLMHAGAEPYYAVDRYDLFSDALACKRNDEDSKWIAYSGTVIWKENYCE